MSNSKLQIIKYDATCSDCKMFCPAFGGSGYCTVSTPIWADRLMGDSAKRQGMWITPEAGKNFPFYCDTFKPIKEIK